MCIRDSVEVAPAAGQAEPSKPAPNKPEPNKPAVGNGSSSGNLGWVIPVAIAGAFGLANLVALLFPFAVDGVLGPIAKR